MIAPTFDRTVGWQSIGWHMEKFWIRRIYEFRIFGLKFTLKGWPY